MAPARLLERNRDAVRRIARQHGASSISIFGSVARGEAGASSDIDFLVEAGPDASPWFPAGLIVDLEELLGCSVHVVTKNALHWYIRDRILKEAAPL